MEKRVIACIDDSASAAAVCDWAAWTSFKLETPLTILHVLDKSERPHESDLSGNIGLGTRETLLEQLTLLDEQRGKLALEQGKQMLEAAKARVEKAGVASKTLQRHANLVETLSEMESEIRLLIVGRQGKKSESALAQIGSQLESVIRTLHCPILVSLATYKIPQKIMIAFDGSPTAIRMLNHLVKYPQLFDGIEVHLVMVGGATDSPLQEAKAILFAEGHESIIARRVGDSLGVALTSYVKANDIDLTVMGAYGTSPIRRFILGSNTTKMLHQTQVPLLLLR
ncbi:MAG TPA: universal stress protein [Oligoflexus sp.]|uniref:universal stress protein n=1 Tax=Oligoflexus sp. TaxID=1971216 RepID=UPI002D653858|nr:universal stress protein [Oligoflexus sp.]HYX34552.1 universal stress protein [Oligoflexus sp.]